MERKMEERNKYLVNYDDSVGWRKLFKIHSKYITSESRLKKKLSIVLPYRDTLVFFHGNDGYWLVDISLDRKLILIDPKGTYTEFDNLNYEFSKPRNHKFIVTDKFGTILILDGDSKSLSNTKKNIRDIKSCLLSDYGEFVYIENNRLNIPDRNISVSLDYRIYEKHSIYCGRNYYSMKVNDIFVSYPFDNEGSIVENSIVYKDRLLYNDASHEVHAHNRYYNYKIGNGKRNRIIEVYNNSDNTLEEIINTAHISEKNFGVYLDSNGTSILLIYYDSQNIDIEIYGP